MSANASEKRERPTGSPLIRLDPEDNILVASANIRAGTPVDVEGHSITTRDDIPAGHKIAMQPIAAGEAVVKYGTTIGCMREAVGPGSWIHSHNLEYSAISKSYNFCRDYLSTALVSQEERASFMGYVRDDGRVATRNHIGVFATSGAAGATARRIAAHFRGESLAGFPNVDGVSPFIHRQGDATEWSGEPLAMLQRTMGGYLRHPNMAGAVIVSTGYEVNDVAALLESQSLTEGPMLAVVVLANEEGMDAAVARGVEYVEAMLPKADEARRTPCSAEHLVVGLQCGGSDGFSSLSANPALGAAVDLLVAHGGTAILSETSEVFGAEHTLTRRAATPEVAQKLLDRIEWWLEYNRGKDTQINGTVAPGNQAGGISNVLEKALGSVKKSGTSPLMDVYRYAESVTARGFVFMDSPGYDPTSATGQIAGGANMIAFTTGRGSCFGSVPAPTFKLATNNSIFKKMAGDMDINCGTVIDGTQSIPELGRSIFEALLRYASGEPTKSEALGMGENEFMPWTLGVVC